MVDSRISPATAVMVAALVLCAMEAVSAVSIAIESYADAQPMFAVLFSALFAGAALLARFRRLAIGAALLSLLCIFEIVSAPSWVRHNLYDDVSQVVGVALSLAGLAVAAWALLTRRSRTAST